MSIINVYIKFEQARSLYATTYGMMEYMKYDLKKSNVLLYKEQ